MLTADLVRVRCRKGAIDVVSLRDAEKARLLHAAEQYLCATLAHAGKARGALEDLFDDVPNQPTDYKLIKGLQKLLTDRCTFEVRDDVDPQAVRKAVFSRATTVRAGLSSDETFNATAVLDTAARELGLSAEDVEASLYADLKENHVLVKFDQISAVGLLERYELAQKQAVLLRALAVSVRLRCDDPAGYRLFFHRLKFLRLLHTIKRDPAGHYLIEIDGPLSLFQAVTKYGLQLALLLPALEDCGGQWQLDAVIRWDKDKEPFRYQLSGQATSTREPVRLPDDVALLLERFARLESAWDADIAREVLELPGIGLCVPDLVFTHRTSGARVFLEVMGYWSRDAVWRRVELVEAGLPHPILFAVSSRLRVSEQVLSDDLPGKLYVYKGVMSAKMIAARLDSLAAATS